MTEVGIIEHMRLFVASTCGKDFGCPAIGNDVGRGITGINNVLEVDDIRQSGQCTALGGEANDLRGN